MRAAVTEVTVGVVAPTRDCNCTGDLYRNPLRAGSGQCEQSGGWEMPSTVLAGVRAELWWW